MNIIGTMLTYLCYCLLILALGCSTPKTPHTINGEVLLEIYTNASDSIYPPGKTLDLRVYENGKTEFDHYLPSDLDKSAPPGPQLKQTTIKDDELARLRSLLEDLDSQSMAYTFQPIVPRSIDERIVVTITYRSREGMKSITLHENDNHLHLDDKSNLYPPVLIKLLKFNYKIGALVRKEAS